MSQVPVTSRPLVSSRAARSAFSPFQFLALALATRQHRRQLLRLDPHLLRDIGLTPEDARAEASRPLWDVPSHWRR